MIGATGDMGWGWYVVLVFGIACLLLALVLTLRQRKLSREDELATAEAFLPLAVEAWALAESDSPCSEGREEEALRQESG